MNINANTKKLIVYLGLTVIICFNLFLYRDEFTAVSDVNDNTYHYALNHEANTIWQKVLAGKLSPLSLLDSWNERWGEGFPLSLNYNHLPQAATSLLSLILSIPLYKFFVFVRTVFLILLPLSFYWAASILGFPLLFRLLLALFSQLIFTDGLYGIDLSSYLWRGWGLSAQLYAVFFLPIAFAYTIQYLDKKKDLKKAILFNFLVAQCHFGMLFLLMLAYLVFVIFYFLEGGIRLAANKIQLVNIARQVGLVKKFTIFSLILMFGLAYFVLPYFLLGDYRNFSYWDPAWKFNSWGMKQVITWFLNGNLFDFNRLPFLTVGVTLGLLYAFLSGRKILQYLGIIFMFFLVLFFGRTTLGSLIDLFPGFSEYHLHRIIVMVQFCGLFLASEFVYKIIIRVLNFIERFRDDRKILAAMLFGIITLGLIIIMERPVYEYASYNNILIDHGNKAYSQDVESYTKLKSKLASLPKARIYAGRPGNWGANLKVGDETLYMALSGDGFPVVDFPPESWSPNVENEQFYNEFNLDSNILYNTAYLIMPSGIKPPEFAKLLAVEGKYYLYQVDAGGWFDFGQSNVTFSGKKNNFINIVHLWQDANGPGYGQYPRVSFGSASDNANPYYRMSSLNSYVLNNKEASIWEKNTFNYAETIKQTVEKNFQNKQESVIEGGYKVGFTAINDCGDCVLVLKQTYHPGWQVTVNGKKVESFPVFPFYTGISVTKAGKYDVVAVYKPNGLKVAMLWIEGLALVGYAGWKMKQRINSKS